jgi:flagellar basal body-associated protein FliL
MKYNKTSMQRGKMMTILVVVTVFTLLVTMTATQAFAAKNLNSSKSNIYRSTQQIQDIEGGGSGEQVSTNTCNCPSNDNIVINQQN